MSISIIAFIVMALVSSLLFVAILAGESEFKLNALRQIGDSSLTPRSVNWLAATAFLGALLICFL